jgi:hypothetical protein
VAPTALYALQPFNALTIQRSAANFPRNLVPNFLQYLMKNQVNEDQNKKGKQIT